MIISLLLAMDDLNNFGSPNRNTGNVGNFLSPSLNTDMDDLLSQIIPHNERVSTLDDLDGKEHNPTSGERVSILSELGGKKYDEEIKVSDTSDTLITELEKGITPQDNQSHNIWEDFTPPDINNIFKTVDDFQKENEKIISDMQNGVYELNKERIEEVIKNLSEIFKSSIDEDFNKDFANYCLKNLLFLSKKMGISDQVINDINGYLAIYDLVELSVDIFDCTNYPVFFRTVKELRNRFLKKEVITDEISNVFKEEMLKFFTNDTFMLDWFYALIYSNNFADDYMFPELKEKEFDERVKIERSFRDFIGKLTFLYLHQENSSMFLRCNDEISISKFIKIILNYGTNMDVMFDRLKNEKYYEVIENYEDRKGKSQSRRIFTGNEQECKTFKKNKLKEGIIKTNINKIEHKMKVQDAIKLMLRFEDPFEDKNNETVPAFTFTNLTVLLPNDMSNIFSIFDKYLENVMNKIEEEPFLFNEYINCYLAFFENAIMISQEYKERNKGKLTTQQEKSNSTYNRNKKTYISFKEYDRFLRENAKRFLNTCRSKFRENQQLLNDINKFNLESDLYSSGYREAVRTPNLAKPSAAVSTAPSVPKRAPISTNIPASKSKPAPKPSAVYTPPAAPKPSAVYIPPAAPKPAPIIELEDPNQQNYDEQSHTNADDYSVQQQYMQNYGNQPQQYQPNYGNQPQQYPPYGYQHQHMQYYGNQHQQQHMQGYGAQQNMQNYGHPQYQPHMHQYYGNQTYPYTPNYYGGQARGRGNR